MMRADAIYPRPGGPSGDDWIDAREECGWHESLAARPAWDRSGVSDLVGIVLFEDDDRRRGTALEKLRRAVATRIKARRDDR
jgi:hypothetical protein